MVANEQGGGSAILRCQQQVHDSRTDSMQGEPNARAGGLSASPPNPAAAYDRLPASAAKPLRGSSAGMGNRSQQLATGTYCGSCSGRRSWPLTAVCLQKWVGRQAGRRMACSCSQYELHWAVQRTNLNQQAEGCHAGANSPDDVFLDLGASAVQVPAMQLPAGPQHHRRIVPGCGCRQQ